MIHTTVTLSHGRCSLPTFDRQHKRGTLHPAKQLLICFFETKLSKPGIFPLLRVNEFVESWGRARDEALKLLTLHP